MPTFPRGHANHVLNAMNARMLEKLARETGGNLAEEREQRYYSTAGDERALRGIPAVGRGCGGGAIRGSRPGDSLR